MVELGDQGEIEARSFGSVVIPLHLLIHITGCL